MYVYKSSFIASHDKTYTRYRSKVQNYYLNMHHCNWERKEEINAISINHSLPLIMYIFSCHEVTSSGTSNVPSCNSVILSVIFMYHTAKKEMGGQIYQSQKFK